MASVNEQLSANFLILLSYCLLFLPRAPLNLKKASRFARYQQHHHHISPRVLRSDDNSPAEATTTSSSSFSTPNSTPAFHVYRYNRISTNHCEKLMVKKSVFRKWLRHLLKNFGLRVRTRGTSQRLRKPNRKPRLSSLDDARNSGLNLTGS